MTVELTTGEDPEEGVGGRVSGAGNFRVIVENLSSRVSWQYLLEAGEVTYADAHRHRRNKGVAYFASYDGRRDRDSTPGEDIDPCHVQHASQGHNRGEVQEAGHAPEAGKV